MIDLVRGSWSDVPFLRKYFEFLHSPDPKETFVAPKAIKFED